jgi:sulfopyruvate decarboxylase subunit alpha
MAQQGADERDVSAKIWKVRPPLRLRAVKNNIIDNFADHRQYLLIERWPYRSVVAASTRYRTVPNRENAQIILQALKRAGIGLVASLPDASLADLIEGLDAANDFIHIPLSREEEGIGVCTGAYLGGMRCAVLMQNAGLLNSGNALTTTALQIEIPMLLLVLYAGARGDMSFPMLGLVTEPVLEGLRIPTYVLNTVKDAPDLVAGAVVQAYNAKKPVAILMNKSVLW